MAFFHKAKTYNPKLNYNHSTLNYNNNLVYFFERKNEQKTAISDRPTSTSSIEREGKETQTFQLLSMLTDLIGTKLNIPTMKTINRNLSRVMRDIFVSISIDVNSKLKTMTNLNDNIEINSQHSDTHVRFNTSVTNQSTKSDQLLSWD